MSGGGAFRQGRKQGEKHIPATQAVLLNEGEIIRRSQSLAGSDIGVVNHFRAGPEGLEGVTGGMLRPVGAGWGPLGGGGGILDSSGGSRGGKVDRAGCRGIGSSGCWTAIVAHIHGFLTVGGGVG